MDEYTSGQVGPGGEDGRPDLSYSRRGPETYSEYPGGRQGGDHGDRGYDDKLDSREGSEFPRQARGAGAPQRQKSVGAALRKRPRDLREEPEYSGRGHAAEPSRAAGAANARQNSKGYQNGDAPPEQEMVRVAGQDRSYLEDMLDREEEGFEDEYQSRFDREEALLREETRDVYGEDIYGANRAAKQPRRQQPGRRREPNQQYDNDTTAWGS